VTPMFAVTSEDHRNIQEGFCRQAHITAAILFMERELLQSPEATAFSYVEIKEKMEEITGEDTLSLPQVMEALHLWFNGRRFVENIQFGDNTTPH